jgi:hypothetical protein
MASKSKTTKITAKQEPLKNGYVVLQVNWEYNDEFYSTDGEGNPISIYLDKEKAEKEKNKLEVLEARRTMLNELTAKGVSEKYQDALLEEGINWDFDDYGYMIPKELPDEKVVKLLDITGLHFYTVEEVPIRG